MNTIQDMRLRQSVASEPASNLTQLEYLALNSSQNLADGHARQELTAAQSRVVAQLPEMWQEVMNQHVEEVERDAHQAYFRMLGQHSYPGPDGRVLSCYSSSVAMEIFARSLVTKTDTVALVHPTFDNIPDILRGVGLRLVPVEEKPLHGDDLDPALLRSAGCLFVTTPNNPTGLVVSRERLERLAAQCAEHDVVLTLDTSFRGFDVDAHYDHYAVLNASGCRWVVIEDTGKLWPTLELKAGFLAWSANVDLPVAKVYSDILLGVSPLVLRLVQRFAEDGAGGGLADLHRFIAGNRARIWSGLAGVPDIGVVDPDSRVSVERLHVGNRSGMKVWEQLRDHDVYVLPCQQFHWADPEQGASTLRIALARPAASVDVAVSALRRVLVK